MPSPIVSLPQFRLLPHILRRQHKFAHLVEGVDDFISAGNPPYTAASPKLPFAGRCRMYCTICQISSSLRMPLEAGIPVGKIPFSITHFSCPSVYPWMAVEFSEVKGGDIYSANGTHVF